MVENQNIESNVNQTEVDKMDVWFDTFIESLQADKFLLKEDLATDETKHLYSILMDGKMIEMMRLSRETSKMYFIESMIKEYLVELKKREVKYKNIALDLGTSKLLSWVELCDDDESSEDKLILTEAFLNAKYHEDGLHISTTIVEERDQTPIPVHYHKLGV